MVLTLRHYCELLFRNVNKCFVRKMNLVKFWLAHFSCRLLNINITMHFPSGKTIFDEPFVIIQTEDFFDMKFIRLLKYLYIL